jgi:hypothetical protein
MTLPKGSANLRRKKRVDTSVEDWKSGSPIPPLLELLPPYFKSSALVLMFRSREVLHRLPYDFIQGFNSLFVWQMIAQ